VERVVKERLVGAAVLMAAAIVLIPEMLSGPDRESREPPAAQVRNDAPIKTYTIDLSQSPSAQPTPGVVDNRAPPPEESAVAEPTEAAAAPQPDAVDQAKPEVLQPSAATPPPVTAEVAPQPEPTRAEPARPVVEQPTAAPPPARTTERPLASVREAPTSGRWAVQVGSFSREATAEKVAKQQRDQGRSAFVMPVKSGAATLYRVRVGPMKDRASAEATLRDVKSSAPGAAIVSHP
jgi:DedD protein